MNSTFDVVIIGGGAAGLFCAIEAGKRGRKVLVIERNSQLGRKIIISGGGRCNFTNTNTAPDNFISNNPHFCKSALARYTPDDFIQLVRKHKIAYYEKKLGQLFCRETSRQIVDMLTTECERARVTIRQGCSVTKVDYDKEFHLETSCGEFSARSLVIATGGLSFPKVGATDFGYRIAKQFGLKAEPVRPSLVPLIFENGDFMRPLAGVSIDSIVSTDHVSFRENILFTHRGLSGPAILQISNYWKRAEEVAIDLLPQTSIAELSEQTLNSRKTVARFLSQFLPDRVVGALAPATHAGKTLDQLPEKTRMDIIRRLKDWRVRFRETEGFDKAEVTIGGVSTAELSSQTMESKNVPGLYFIGEIVDVTGWLGGYNFQWAWASAHAAGRVV